MASVKSLVVSMLLLFGMLNVIVATKVPPLAPTIVTPAPSSSIEDECLPPTGIPAPSPKILSTPPIEAPTPTFETPTPVEAPSILPTTPTPPKSASCACGCDIIGGINNCSCDCNVESNDTPIPIPNNEDSD